MKDTANETIVVDGQTLQFIHSGHAHTKGDLIIYLPQEKVLITGDVLFHLRTHGFQDTSPLGNLVALRSLKKLDFNRVIPGHGPVTEKSSTDRMIEDVYLLYEEVKKRHNNGLSDFEM